MAGPPQDRGAGQVGGGSRKKRVGGRSREWRRVTPAQGDRGGHGAAEVRGAGQGAPGHHRHSGELGLAYKLN